MAGLFLVGGALFGEPDWIPPLDLDAEAPAEEAPGKNLEQQSGSESARWYADFRERFRRGAPRVPEDLVRVLDSDLMTLALALEARELEKSPTQDRAKLRAKLEKGLATILLRLAESLPPNSGRVVGASLSFEAASGSGQGNVLVNTGSGGDVGLSALVFFVEVSERLEFLVRVQRQDGLF